jgi:hypothetical protein
VALDKYKTGTIIHNIGRNLGRLAILRILPNQICGC